MRAARGAVLGNAAVLLAVHAFTVVLAVCYAAVVRKPLVSACRRVALPSSLLPFWAATIPSTAAATTELLLSAPITLQDIFVVLLGLLHCGLPLLCISLVARLQLTFSQLSANAPSQGSTTRGARWRFNAVFRIRGEWKTGAAAHAMAADCAHVLLVEYKVRWFAAVDLTGAAASGALAAISGSSSNGCVGAVVSIVVMYAALVVLCLKFKPYTTRYAHIHALMTYALLMLNACMHVASRKWGTAAPELLNGAAACELCVLGISLLRLVVDVCGGGNALICIVKEMWQSHRLTDASGCNTIPPLQDGSTTDNPIDVDMVPVDDTSSVDFFDSFWDENENALQLRDDNNLMPMAMVTTDLENAFSQFLPLHDDGGAGSNDTSQHSPSCFAPFDTTCARGSAARRIDVSKVIVNC